MNLNSEIESTEYLWINFFLPRPSTLCSPPSGLQSIVVWLPTAMTHGKNRSERFLISRENVSEDPSLAIQQQTNG
jgi:hypothetical protein